MTQSNQRLNPDALLDLIKKEDDDRHLGKLRVFLGMSAGVGKTYSMLKAAHQRQEEGLTVVIGAVEAHGRSDTHALIEGLSTIKRKQSKYRDTVIEEMDLDAILKLKPDLVVVDELAHTNAPGVINTQEINDCAAGTYTIRVMISGGNTSVDYGIAVNDVFFYSVAANTVLELGPFELGTGYSLLVTDGIGCVEGITGFALCTVPVSLLSFTGSAAPDGNQLRWTTASGVNNHYFILQHSMNGIQFTNYRPNHGSR